MKQASLLFDGPRRREAARRHSPASVRSYLSGRRLCRLPPLVPRLLPQSSSASRFTAGAAGFLILSQWLTRPERYGEPSRFDTMPSQPSAHACWKMTAVAVEMLIEGNTVAGVSEKIGEYGLAALERRPPEVLAVERDQIEGAKHGGMVAKPIAEKRRIPRGRVSSTTIASPSTTHDRTGRLSTAATIFG